MEHDHSAAGFKDRTMVAEARNRLLSTVTPLDRTRTLSLMDADGRVLAEELTAARPVPHYARAAMDGYAVRAEDTFGADDQTPATLRIDEELAPGTAVRVHTGSELPEGADAVVMVEQTEQVTDTKVEVFDAIAGGENVAPVGEGVQEGQKLYSPGHRLRPSDLGLLKSVGFSNIDVYERPTVSGIPTGEELVQSDPDLGEVIETNGQTVTHYVRRWGGLPTYRDVVTDDPDLLRTVISRDSDHDIYGIRPVERELRNTVVWLSRGFDRPHSRDTVDRFLTDLEHVVDEAFDHLVEHTAQRGLLDATYCIGSTDVRAMPADQDASECYDPAAEEYYDEYRCTIVSSGSKS